MRAAGNSGCFLLKDRRCRRHVSENALLMATFLELENSQVTTVRATTAV